MTDDKNIDVDAERSATAVPSGDAPLGDISDTRGPADTTGESDGAGTETPLGGDDAPVLGDDDARAVQTDAAGATPATDTPATDTPATDTPATETAIPAPETTDAVAPQYGVGPLSIRETALVGVWALGFVFSFFPIYGRFGAGTSVWGAGIDWVLTIGVPTVAVFLILLRRFSPQGIRRVGSLGIDQFASVAFSVSATVWLGIIWSAFVALAQTRVFVASWVVWVELVLMLGGVILTVVAPHLPVLGDDFRHRPEAPAHRSARATRPVAARPVVERDPAGAASVPTASGFAAPNGYAFADATGPVDAAEPFDADATTVMEQAPAQQAFWALVPEERDVLDESGAPLFRIGPTAWALVIEDRGEAFVVRHEDGRVGFLHDTSDVTRG